MVRPFFPPANQEARVIYSRSSLLFFPLPPLQPRGSAHSGHAPGPAPRRAAHRPGDGARGPGRVRHVCAGPARPRWDPGRGSGCPRSPGDTGGLSPPPTAAEEPGLGWSVCSAPFLPSWWLCPHPSAANTPCVWGAPGSRKSCECDKILFPFRPPGANSFLHSSICNYLELETWRKEKVKYRSIFCEI